MCCPGRPRAFDAVLSSRVRDAEGGAAALEGPRAGCGVLGPGGVGRPRKRAAARLRRPGGFPTARDEPSWRGACSARPERPAGSLSGPLRRCPQGGGCRRSRAGCRLMPGRGRGGAAVAGLLRGDARRAAGAAVPKPGQGPAPPGREAPPPHGSFGPVLRPPAGQSAPPRRPPPRGGARRTAAHRPRARSGALSGRRAAGAGPVADQVSASGSSSSRRASRGSRRGSSLDAPPPKPEKPRRTRPPRSPAPPAISPTSFISGSLDSLTSLA